MGGARGGVVCFPRLKRGGASDEICKLLVKKYRTFTVPGYVFDMDRHFRLGFGGDEEELRSGLERLEMALKEILK